MNTSITDRVVIRVEELAKSYVLGVREQGIEGLRHAIQDTAVAPFRHVGRWLRRHGRRSEAAASHVSRRPTSDTLWALKDVSFDVTQGEVIGIIGRNGAGKSTLLKILSRITEPTSGRVGLKGRVASLLEVGTGFHPELTGRENIYLNGAILGMTRKEITSKFDEIVAFAELERFLDTPVKRYSSGMYVRLAFAVAAHLEPEILIVDEVLAVGDAAFQQKCLGKINNISREEARTVLFVSHNMAVVRDLCDRAIYVDAGQIVSDGPCREVVSLYLNGAIDSEARTHWRRLVESPVAKTSITELLLKSDEGHGVTEIVIGDPLSIVMKVAFQEPVAAPQFGVMVHTKDGTPILDLRTRHSGLNLPKAQGDISLRIRVASLGLYPGEYFLSPWVTDSSDRDLDWVQYCLAFSVLAKSGPFGDMRLSLNWGKYYVPSEWVVESRTAGDRRAKADYLTVADGAGL